MGIIKYSALVESIQGKVNGSTLRMQAGTGIIQNKPYRNPVGMAGIGVRTQVFGTLGITFWNLAYRQAMQFAAHNPNPFPSSISDIRQAINNYGFVDAAANGSDTVAIATALAPYFMMPNAGNPTIVLPSFVMTQPEAVTVALAASSTLLRITVSIDPSLSDLGFILDMSPPSPLTNYRLRQRVSIRIASGFPSSGIQQDFLPQSILSIPVLQGSKVWVYVTLGDNSVANIVSPRSAPRLIEVESI
jgi:hypothetical protein